MHMNAREWVTGAAGDRVTGDKVMADLRVLAADMEELLKATAGQTGHQVAQVRARAEESLAAVKGCRCSRRRWRKPGRRAGTDDYAHANRADGLRCLPPCARPRACAAIAS
jgi:ElaB/YqjD/DUF883 family membrane-anchored ribosome-binding protein